MALLAGELVVLVGYLIAALAIMSNPLARALTGGPVHGPGFTASWELREWLVILWLLTVAGLATGGAYRLRLNLSVWEQLPALSWRAGIALATTLALVDRLHGPLARDAVAILGVAGLGSHLAVRIGTFALLREARQGGWTVSRALVLGGGTLSFKAVELLETHRELGLLVLGYLDDAPAPLSSGPPGWAYLGRVEDLPSVVRRLQIQTVVVGFGVGSDALAAQALRRSELGAGVQVLAVPRLFELGRRPIGQDHAGPIPLIRVRSASRRGPRWVVKRALDVVVAVVAFVVLAPLLAGLALAVRLEGGPGPVVVGVDYVGRRGVTVRLRRFRTARPDRGPGPVGRLLRRTRLGWLPLLWNLFTGELSMVGPPPVIPQASQRLQQMLPHYEHRLQVPGGLVGPGAASPGRGEPPVDEAVLYDTAYVENWGLWTDATVLMHGLRRFLARGWANGLTRRAGSGAQRGAAGQAREARPW